MRNGIDTMLHDIEVVAVELNIHLYAGDTERNHDILLLDWCHISGVNRSTSTSEYNLKSGKR